MFVVHCFVDLQGHFKPLHIDPLIINIQKAIKIYIQNPILEFELILCSQY